MGNNMKHCMRITILYAQEKLGIKGWKPYIYSRAEETAPPGFMKLTGIVPGIYKKGPKKGQENWDTGDPATRKTIFVSDAQSAKFAEEWERTTGRCVVCAGDGKTIRSCSAIDGTKYEDCKNCNGTGVSPEFPENFTPDEPDPEPENNLFSGI